jgi:hypothetical protein
LSDFDESNHTWLPGGVWTTTSNCFGSVPAQGALPNPSHTSLRALGYFLLMSLDITENIQGMDEALARLEAMEKSDAPAAAKAADAPAERVAESVSPAMK